MVKLGYLTSIQYQKLLYDDVGGANVISRLTPPSANV